MQEKYFKVSREKYGFLILFSYIASTTHLMGKIAKTVFFSKGLYNLKIIKSSTTQNILIISKIFLTFDNSRLKEMVSLLHKFEGSGDGTSHGNRVLLCKYYFVTPDIFSPKVLLIMMSYFQAASLGNWTQEQTVLKSFLAKTTPLRNLSTLED